MTNNVITDAEKKELTNILFDDTPKGLKLNNLGLKVYITLIFGLFFHILYLFIRYFLTKFKEIL